MVISAETTSLPPDPPTRLPVAASATEVSGGTFSFPVLKTWGNRRAFRFSTPNSKGGGVSRRGYGLSDANDVAVDAGDVIGRPTGNGKKEDMALQDVREKLLVHLREAADGLKLMGPSSSKDADEGENGGKAEHSPSAVRPWNLRTRQRSRAGIPSGNDRYLSRSSPEKRTVRLRSKDSEPKARPVFSIALTREEIDEDIYAVTGHRARGRPRKRPRAVQRQLDPLVPGSWLSEITVDSYKVRE